MAKLNVSILGHKILGTLADAITFDYQHKTQIIKRKPIPTDRRTNLQLQQRQKMRSCATSWEALDPDEKQAYINKAKGYPQTAFGLFLTTCLMAPPTPPTKICDGDQDTCWDVEQTPDGDEVHGKTNGVEAFLIDSDGIRNLAKQSSAGISSNAGQSIPDSTWTFLTYNGIEYDVQGEADLTNNWIKVKTAGTYLVAMNNAIYSFPSPYLLACTVWGSVHGEIAYGNVESSCTKALRATAFGICFLDADETVRGKLYQSTGSAQSLSTYASQNFLRIYKLG